MDTPSVTNFTLQQLANLALGTEQITGVNTILLHSLLNQMLKKLNCQNEKVSIDGYEAMQMQRILNESTVTPIVFNEQNFDVILKRFDNLDKMEKSLNETETQLNEHLLGIRQYLSRLEQLVPCRFKDDDYYELCEDICSTLDPDIESACDTLRRSAFLRRILVCICHPAIRTYVNLETRIEMLENELCLLMNRLDAKFDVLHLINTLTDDFEWCSQEYESVHESFLKALNEIQDILDAKVNKYQMVQLKDYITERYDSIWEQLNKLQLEGRCQRAAAVLIDDDDDETGSKKPFRKSKQTCQCDGVHLHAAREQKLMDRIARVDIKRVKVLLETKGRRSCYTP
ncbi:uncharacterized protein [Eurosta solidaginis]|uniref:uncharacterized protein n=1 Tax=Eurosta solidaginis TaxID=178769 RepID=UPI0035316005